MFVAKSLNEYIGFVQARPDVAGILPIDQFVFTRPAQAAYDAAKAAGKTDAEAKAAYDAVTGFKKTVLDAMGLGPKAILAKALITDRSLVAAYVQFLPALQAQYDAAVAQLAADQAAYDALPTDPPLDLTDYKYWFTTLRIV